MIENVLLLLFLMVCSAFFSASETALTGASRARIYALANQGNARAKTVGLLHTRMARVIATILLGNTFFNNAAAALTTVVLTSHFGSGGFIPLIAAAIITIALFIFSEVLPKTYAINNADRVSLSFSPAVKLLTDLTYPLTRPTQLIVNATLRLFGVRVVNQPGSEESLEELRGAIDLHSESAEEIREAGAMLHSILDLDEVPVADIMTHRRNVTMIDADQSPEAIVTEALASPHTRIPLYRGEPDNVAGVLHAKALLRAIQGNGWRIEGLDIVAMSAKPWFIPAGTSLLNQLEAFKDRREHFAIVVDEYGALMGVVTLEDIIEEIVGDITDEHDQHVRGVVAEPSGSYLVDGNVTIRDLNREFDWNLPDEAASTIAGLVLHEARQIPVPGQVFGFYGLRLEILERQRNQIRRIRVTRMGGGALPSPAASIAPAPATRDKSGESR